MPVKKIETKAKTIIKPAPAATSKLAAEAFDVLGKSQGTVGLSKEVFSAKENPSLLAQAYRVYFANDNPRMAHTKTRGEVRGGGRKPWRQKGTGRARAGSSRSPLWVGGGITFGPRYHDLKISLPQKMKQKSLPLALTQKLKSGSIKVITNLESVSPKTKIVSGLLAKLGTKGTTLIVISEKNQNLKLATRNIQNLSTENVKNLNAYKVLKHTNLIFSKEAIAKLS